MEEDIDLDQNNDDLSDVESLTSVQDIDLLAGSSQISVATAMVPAGTLPLLFPEGAILPLPLMASNFNVDTSNVQLGIDTISAENIPLPVSEDDAPSKTFEGLDVPHKNEGMDVVVESTEEEQLCPVTQQAASSNMRPTEIRLSLMALQHILDSRMVKTSIDRVAYMHINKLISYAKYDEEFSTKDASICNIPKDESSYSAILSALNQEPLELPYDLSDWYRQ